MRTSGWAAVAAAGVAAASAWVLGAAPATAPAAADVTVTALKGEATVSHPDKSQVPAKVGLVLAPGDEVSVAPGGILDLKLGDGNVLKLMGGSRFRVGEPKPKAPEFDLLQGEMFAALDLLPPGSRTSVRTPTGVAGVEGTHFRVAADPATKAMEVTVANGAVNLQSAEQTRKQVTVGRQQTARVVPWRDAVLRATGTAVPADLDPSKEEPDKTTIVSSVTVVIPKGATSDTEAETQAEVNALPVALADIANRLARYSLSKTETLGSRLLKQEGGVARMTEYVGTAKITRRRKTRDGRLLVEVSLDLAGLRDLVGLAGGFTRTIREVTKEEYGRAIGGLRRIQAEAAARQDAQRQLVERIYGVVIDARTTVRDMAAADDVIQVRTQGVLRGAKAVAYRYFSDGTVEVDMEVVGQDLVSALDPAQRGRFGDNYLSKPEPGDLATFVRFQQLGL